MIRVVVEAEFDLPGGEVDGNFLVGLTQCLAECQLCSFWANKSLKSSYYTTLNLLDLFGFGPKICLFH